MERKRLSAIELTVVAACLIGVLALAMDTKIRAQIASNEKSAIGSLKSCRDMNVIFKAADQDRNTINDYWTYDISGLYRVLNAAGSEIKTIDLSLAQADTNPIAAIANYIGSAFVSVIPRAGYYFTAMTTDEMGSPYRINPIVGTTIYALHNSKFAFCAYPEVYERSGTDVFIVSQDGIIWKKDIGVGTPVRTWPAPNPNIVQWGNID